MDSCHQNHIEKLKSGHPVPKLRLVSRSQGLPHPLREHIMALGPMPETCLAIFLDLGLSDREIARYFDVPKASIAKLCDIWNIHH
jgi:hypothetical protein